MEPSPGRSWPPSGTVTFLFTDIEGSTRMWEQHPADMRAALERHDRLLRSAIDEHGGFVFSTAGDSFGAAFARAGDAIKAALAAQTALAAERWPESTPLRVRMGVHSGEAQERDGNYFGTAVNRAARIMSAANGGQVLSSEVSLSLAEVSAAEDLGERRLRDLTEPVRLVRLGVPGVEPVELPPRTLDALPGNLPVQATSFLGRAELLTVVADAMRESRLVTLTGVGGVGKTRSALQVAAEMAPEFSHGAWLVGLATVRDGTGVPSAVGAVLGLRPDRNGELGADLVRHLSGWQTLLVLDNAEHVVGDVATMAEELLSHCDGVQILVTSREGLALPSERLIAVPPLSMETAEDEEVSEAARLFEERARAANPGFAMTADVVGDVNRLCARLDGVPLAIELAAARVRMMTPAEIDEHLHERFRLLTGGARTAAARHQTLRASVDWSFDLLPDTAKTVFERLGVFVGSFDLQAVQALTGGRRINDYAVIDAMTTLIDQSLLVADQTVEGTRYRMLETLRQYALDKLAAGGELDRVRRRHGEVFAARANEAGTRFLSAAQLEVKRQVEADADNYRAAIGYALQSDDVNTAFDISAALTPLHQYGHLSGDLARQVLAASAAETHPLFAVVSSGPIYDHWMPAGERPSLDLLYNTPRAPLRPITTKIIETYDPMYRREPDQALDSARRWITEASKENSDYDTSYAYAVLSHLQFITGRDASEAAARSLAIAEELNIPGLLQFAHLVTGMGQAKVNPAAATEHFTEALRHATIVDAEIGVGMAAAHLAGTAADPETAHHVVDVLRPYLTTEALDRPGGHRSFSLWVALFIALVQIGETRLGARLLGYLDNLRGSASWSSTDIYSDQALTELRQTLDPDELEPQLQLGAGLTAIELLSAVRDIFTQHQPTRADTQTTDR